MQCNAMPCHAIPCGIICWSASQSVFLLTIFNPAVYSYNSKLSLTKRFTPSLVTKELAGVKEHVRKMDLVRFDWYVKLTF